MAHRPQPKARFPRTLWLHVAEASPPRSHHILAIYLPLAISTAVLASATGLGRSDALLLA